MVTFQDLLLVGENDRRRGLFCEAAINSFRNSTEYKKAQDAEAYYSKHNLTIERYQKMLYTLSGRAVVDVFSTNYKLKTKFFRRLVTQQVQYVLGNGLTLQEPENKEKLGRKFDYMLQKAAKKSMVHGVAFGFWNLDHLEVFGFADTKTDAGFCPLYDEETAKLRAGIRFWYKAIDANKKILRCTLYEEDGYTEYLINSGDVEVVNAKRGYIQTTIKTAAGGVEQILEDNYTTLPIVPLYANDLHESELDGMREDIDCYDFIKSGLANEIDDTSGFYWILHNTGGMEDVDLAKFMQRMKTVHGAVINGDEGAGAEAHTIDVPFEARRTMLEILRADIYEDFQALDLKQLSAAQKTTQEIQAAYQSMDNKCADFEYNILDFVEQIMTLAGVDDTPTFVWNKVVNMAEQTNTVLSAANYLTDELIIKHLPFLTPEEADEAAREMNNSNYDRFNDEEAEEEEPQEPIIEE